MAGREETEIAAVQTALGKGCRAKLFEPQNAGHYEAEMFHLAMNLNQATVQDTPHVQRKFSIRSLFHGYLSLFSNVLNQNFGSKQPVRHKSV